MTITSVNSYLAAPKQDFNWTKTAARTTVAAIPFSVFDLAGQPGAGALAAGNTANGIVPTDASTGFPLIDAFSGGNQGILSNIQFSSNVACTIYLFDCLFRCGAYAFNANTNLASQPSFTGRIPSDDLETELWAEAVTAFTGNPSFNVTYSNELGTGARSTGTVASGAALTVGRCLRLPLQAGDRGVTAVGNVTGSVATVGTFNILVMRRLAKMRVRSANDGDVHDLLKLARKRVYDTSALYVLVAADSTSSGLPDLGIQIANG